MNFLVDAESQQRIREGRTAVWVCELAEGVEGFVEEDQARDASMLP